MDLLSIAFGALIVVCVLIVWYVVTEKFAFGCGGYAECRCPDCLGDRRDSE